MIQFTAFLTALTPLVVALIPVMLAAFAALTIVLNNRRDKKMDQVAALAKQTADQAAEKVREVANVAADSVRAAEQRSDRIMEKTNEIHTLVNSQYGLALALILEKAIRLAEVTHDPEDIKEVEKARMKVAEHESRQHVIDLRKEGV